MLVRGAGAAGGCAEMVFEILWAKAGFGSVKLGIRLREEKYRKGGVVRGDLHLGGGTAAQDIRGLSIRLVWEWSTEHYGMEMIGVPDPLGRYAPWAMGPMVEADYEVQGDTGSDVVSELILAREFKVSPGEQRIFSFDLPIPKREAGVMVSEQWKLRAQADIPRARDVIIECGIAVD